MVSCVYCENTWYNLCNVHIHDLDIVWIRHLHQLLPAQDKCNNNNNRVLEMESRVSSEHRNFGEDSRNIESCDSAPCLIQVRSRERNLSVHDCDHSTLTILSS